MRWSALLILGAALGTGAGACGGAEPDERMAGDASSVPPESTTASDPGATAQGNDVRVVFIGTSLTAGMGLDSDSAYPAVIQRLADSADYNVHVQAAGVSGETSAGALRRVGWVMQNPADVVVIETGANDGLRGLDPDTTEANIKAMVDSVRAKNPDVRVLVAQMEAPPNLGARYTREFRDVFMNVSREKGVTLIPFFLEGVAGEATLNQADGIHPNAEGARQAARNMWKALSPVLREVPGVLDR